MKKLTYYTTVFAACLLIIGMGIALLNYCLRNCETLFSPLMTVQEENTLAIITAFPLAPVCFAIIIMATDNWDRI